jgi:hypothetical protein
VTANELRAHFNQTFGVSPWPLTFEVDAATYGHACQAVFASLMKAAEEADRTTVLQTYGPSFDKIGVAIGPNGGILFKNVELLLREKGLAT